MNLRATATARPALSAAALILLSFAVVGLFAAFVQRLSSRRPR